MATITMKQSSGYTLVELMVTVAIVAIFTTFAVPAFNAFVTNNRLVNVVNGVAGGINYARSEAVSRGTSVAVCAGNGSTTAPACSGSNDWTNGYIVHTDINSNGVLDGADQILRVQGDYGDNINVLGASVQTVVFSNEGFLESGNGNIDFCSDYNDRRLTIAANGNVRLSMPVCP